MPPQVFGTYMESKRANLDAAPDYHYEYPYGLDLNPKKQFHKLLLGRILSRANESAKTMQHRYRSWNGVEEILNVYTPWTKEEYRIKNEDRRKPVSMVVPVSYAVLETLLTYYVAAFLEEPFFKYVGVDESGHDAIGGRLMEKVIHLQMIHNKVALRLHTMWRDAFIYGISLATPGWRVHTGVRPKKQTQRTWSDDMGRFMETPTGEVTEEEATLFEGSTLTNIDPYMVLLDPYVSADRIQEGEYVGWVTRTNTMNMLREEAGEEDSGIFNVKYLKHMREARSSYFKEGDSVREKDKYGKTHGYSLSHPADNLEMYITLIPNDWGLSNVTKPEIWWFRVTGDALVTGAKTLGLWHGMYPCAVNAPDFDGYGISPISRLEVVQPMQEALNWMISSHVANVRKAINDTLVYDPYVINANDVNNPEPGKAIRVRRAAWGRGKIKESIMQLPITDITRGHVQDASYFFGEIQKISAAADSLLGIERRSGERVTAAEFQGRSSNAISRLAKAAKMTSIMAHQDLAYMFASHTQQFMSVPAYVDIIGEDEDLLRSTYGITGKIMAVNPEDVRVFIDVVPRDGTILGSDNASVWVQLYQTIMTNPELIQLFDVSRIFQHIARMLGAKSVHEFMKKGEGQVQTQVLPDQDVASMIRSGDLMPIGGGE